MVDEWFFLNPEWLTAGIVILAVLVYMARRAEGRKRRAALIFSRLKVVREAAGGRELAWRRSAGFLMSALALTCLFASLADLHVPWTATHKGVNVVLVIDVSGSMQATDFEPNRLEAAKQSARVLIESLKPVDYCGIIVFSEGATAGSYLTRLKDRTIQKLDAIRPREGRTAIGDGLSLAVDMITSVPNRRKVVILLSDGENNAGVIPPAEAAAFAKREGVQVYTVGVGSVKPVVLGYDWFGRAQYARLDEETLRQIAGTTGGEYFRAVDVTTLEHIYQTLSEKIEHENEDVSTAPWFVGAAVLLILAEQWLRYGGGRIIP